LCVEPVTHAPNALNDPATSAAIRALAPGERMESTLRITVA
jgi:galactose mutarotase-like enzyme